MTTLATRIKEVRTVEGFKIEVLLDGTLVDDKKQGVPSYAAEFSNKMKDAATVSDWKTVRFGKVFEGYTCRVLKANVEEAHGNTALGTVRSSYTAQANPSDSASAPRTQQLTTPQSVARSPMQSPQRGGRGPK